MLLGGALGLVHLFAAAALAVSGGGGAPVPTGGAPAPGAGPGTGSTGLPHLSTAQKAGERVILSYAGPTPPVQLLSALRAGDAAGVIFFRDNITSRGQFAHVVAQLESAASHSPVKAPLLLMTDQEGGLVRRLPGAPSLSEKQIGSSAHSATLARQAGQGAAANLAGVGLNVNLAPVLDVFRQPGNFIDEFGRSYSSSPSLVAGLGADFIAAQQHGGVAATAKHFPGLGAAATAQNTDERPVTLTLSKRTLRTVDELPYRSAIRAGVRLVMLSWAVYPAFDRRPAGLSATIVQGELRNRLHFHGVTITDALGAGALRAFGGTQHRALLAAGAGMDLLLCASQSVSEGLSAESALASALRHHTLNGSTFDAAVARVIALRRGLPH